MSFPKISIYASHDLRIVFALIHSNSLGDTQMNTDFQLVGKTITGIVANPGKGSDPHKIWMLQFSDGTHVEFVSPTARRRLNSVTGAYNRAVKACVESPKMNLNVA
jgi:hypothetical protein